jgi:hypothetical protein
MSGEAAWLIVGLPLRFGAQRHGDRPQKSPSAEEATEGHGRRQKT